MYKKNVYAGCKKCLHECIEEPCEAYKVIALLSVTWDELLKEELSWQVEDFLKREK